ncbi:MAG: hypothetical protein P8165_19530 [Deltaproteobacteria bacterium]
MPWPAAVTTPQVISPKRIKVMQDALDETLERKTDLIIRCEITKDVSSTGSASGVVGQDLDGDFVTTNVHPKVRRLQLAEQVLREIFVNYPNLYLDNLDLVELSNKPVSEVAKFQAAIRQRLGDETVRLLLRCDDLVDVTSKGRILYGRAHFGQLSPQEEGIQKNIEYAIRSQVMRLGNMFAPNVDAQKRNGKWHVRAEVVGPRVLAPEEIKTIEQRVSDAVKENVTLHAWCRVELVVTDDRMASVEDFTKELVKKRGDETHTNRSQKNEPPSGLVGALFSTP